MNPEPSICSCSIPFLLVVDVWLPRAGNWPVTLTRAPLSEERARNRITAARLKRQKDRHEAWKVAEVTKHIRNDAWAR